MPFKGKYRVTSPYGWRTLNGMREFHNGVDIVGVDDTTVVCPLDGTVLLSAYGTECGNQIQVYTRSHRTMFFCHLAARYVSAGNTVSRGQALGIMGATGTKCYGAHLHFGVYDGKGRNVPTIDAGKFLKI